MKRLASVLALAALLLLAACSATVQAAATPGGSATASSVTAIAAGSLPPTELKYRLLDEYPDFFYCDPDSYPVARGDEGQLALERFPAIQADVEEFAAILSHNSLTGQTSFTDEQKQLIYQEHKKLAALHLEPAGEDYQFQIITGGGGKQGFAVQGTIDRAGHITVTQRSPTFATCPICLARHTLIDTPMGPRAVEDIRAGDVIWTLDAEGGRMAQPVLKTARVPVGAGHLLVHVKLADGRGLRASPGHPTADGRVLAQLRAGDWLDGALVLLAEQFSYDGSATYDLLPAGPTGFYWADGILMGSTLHP